MDIDVSDLLVHGSAGAKFWKDIPCSPNHRKAYLHFTMPTEFTPVGDMPWGLMLCAALIYMLVVKYKKNRYEI